MKSVKRDTVRWFSSLRPRFNSENHMEKSFLPTYHFQDALPRLEIPPLEASAKKYVDSIKGLIGHPEVTTDDAKRAEKMMSDFIANDGAKLHQLLVENDQQNSHTSFIYDMWGETYLSDRRPLPMTHNPSIVWCLHKNKALRTQKIRATQLIWASAKFYKTLEDNLLGPEIFLTSEKVNSSKIYPLAARMLPNKKISAKKFGIENQSMRFISYAANGAFPLDMSQFPNLFHSTRIPQPEKDIIQKASNKRRYVIVLHKGRVYAVDAFDENWNVRKPAAIMGDIDEILHQGQTKPYATSVPALTSLDRDEWSDARQHLLKLGNAEALAAVDEGLFCIALDEIQPKSISASAMSFLAGDARSRWFDKSFSCVITGDSGMTINYEHAWGDGIPILRFMEAIDDHINIENPVTETMRSEPGNPKEITFKLDDKANHYIDNAVQFHNNRMSKLHTEVLPMGDAPLFDNTAFFPADYDFPGKKNDLSRRWLREKKLGPDGFFQLSLQLAYSQLYGHPVSVYESCSTAAFKHGRTETIRTATMESNALQQMFLKCNFDSASDTKDLNTAIRQSIRKHNGNTKDALQGNGFDRHLFALQYTAKKHNLPIPEIFLDHNHAVLNKFVLSTSTLNSKSVQYGGFAPTTPGGYGIGYMVFDDWIGACVCGFKDESPPGEFLNSLDDVWTKMRSVF